MPMPDYPTPRPSATASRVHDVGRWLRSLWSRSRGAVGAVWVRTQTMLTVRSEEADTELHSPLLDLTTAVAWAAVLVFSVWPLGSRPDAAKVRWLMGALAGLTGFCWGRSGAYVKREALQRRRLVRFLPVAWYHWSWTDYEKRGRFWVVAYWVIGLVTVWRALAFMTP